MSKTLREMFDELIMAVPFTNAETRYIPKIKVALEKQIPKKPKYIDGDYDMPICPNCSLSLYGHEEDSYCSICGQALDWSDSE